MSDQNDLEQKISDLEKIINSFKEAETKRSKKQYEKIKIVIQDALNDSEDLENRFEKTLGEINLTNFLLLLTSANNPTNSSLGFNLFDTITKIADDVLASELIDDDRNKPKTRFLDIIGKVINNPIADILLKSNPIGAIVTNVMNTASNFIDSTATGGAFKKAYVETKDVIIKEKLNKFSDKLKKYELFYTDLLSATKIFRNKLDSIKSKNLNLIVSLRDYHKIYLETLGINPETQQINQFNEIFKLTEINGEYNYSEILEKTEISNAIIIAEKMPSFETQVKTFIQEFETSFSEFLTNYTKVLKSALNWESNEINKTMLRNFISEIENYNEDYFIDFEEINQENNLVTLRKINPTKILNIA
jgi:hypothetical protein